MHPRLVLPAAAALRTARHTTSSLQRSPASVFQRTFASTDADNKGTQNSRPGWTGRYGDDHATKRDRLDIQGDASQEGLKKGQEGKDAETNTASGQAISRQDENRSNERAKQENPEAPEPVIGMNSERGSKGH